jgi:hypothetical protein
MRFVAEDERPVYVCALHRQTLDLSGTLLAHLSDMPGVSEEHAGLLQPECHPASRRSEAEVSDLSQLSVT